MLSKKDIELIQTNWWNSPHSKTNPKGYYIAPNYKNVSDEKYAQLKRILDLISLIEIIYEWDQNKPDYFISGQKMNNDGLLKYILNDIIKAFPFNGYSREIIEHISNPSLKDWVEEIFRMNDRKVNWIPVKIGYPKLFSIDSEDLNKLLQIRFDRFHLLSELCHQIDNIQYEDYLRNQIVINSKGKFINGNLDGLVYGYKHSLSAFLGQCIVRKFPFKDITEFHSTGWKKGDKMVYEHYTPMSFFRDLIWVKNIAKDISEPHVFNFEEKFSSPLPHVHWLSILWHLYRTIKISHFENLKLDNNGYRMRRPYNVYGESIIDITLPDSLKTSWEGIHSVNLLETLWDNNKLNPGI